MKRRSRSTKVDDLRVREMYMRLRSKEINQGEASLIYGIGVIQVGRIARGESRAEATGARDDRIPNFNLLENQDTEAAAKASWDELQRRMEPKAAPSLYSDPPPTEEHRSDVLEQLTTDIAQHPTTQTSEALGELLTVDSTQKGDQK